MPTTFRRSGAVFSNSAELGYRSRDVNWGPWRVSSCTCGSIKVLMQRAALLAGVVEHAFFDAAADPRAEQRHAAAKDRQEAMVNRPAQALA